MIWCVEDDNNIREIEIYALNSTGFKARGFCDGNEFLQALKKEKPKLIILDVMLPGRDGVELLRMLKASVETKDIPVIMATAKGSEYEKVQSLDIGADDYLVKPFGVMEMVSRVKAVLRRCNGQEQDKILASSGVTIDLTKHVVMIDQEKVTLTFKEFELLRVFLSYPGIVFSRDKLFNDIWGMDYCGETRTVDVHIRTLRQKLKQYGNKIETVRNVGYRWEAEND